MADIESKSTVAYRCVQCGSNLFMDQLSIMLETKCPNCGFRVLRKVRPAIVKQVKAQ